MERTEVPNNTPIGLSNKTKTVYRVFIVIEHTVESTVR